MRLRTESRLILAAARPRLSDQEINEIGELISTNAATLDWGFIVDQAYHHKVLPMMAHNFLDHHLYPSMSEKRLKFRHERLFRLVGDANAARNEALLRELTTLLREFARQGVPALVRKGPVLMQEVYGDTRMRHMNDLDMMFEKGDLPLAREILGDMGYTPGNVSRNRRTLVPMDRAETAYWAMHVPNIVLRRSTSERFVDYFMVDICLNQFLPGSGHDLPAGGFSTRAREVVLFGAPALAFLPEEMLIDLCVHLYKEATTLYYIALGKDLCLSKFLDVAEYARTAAPAWDSLVRLCHDRDIREPVYFGMHFADLLYPGAIPEAVLAELRPDDVSYLDQFGFADGDVRRWNDDFLSRMFDSARADEVPNSKALI